jgi:hypothetical protein
MVAVCDFEPSPAPSYRVTASMEKKACAALRPPEARVTPVPFPLMHALINVPRRPGDWASKAIPGMARIDIDGDGAPDNVVRIENSHGAGRGCGTQYLAMADDTRTSLIANEVNRYLLEGIGGHCGSPQQLVEWRGRAFVMTEDDGRRELHEMSARGGREVCAAVRAISYRMRMLP